MKRQNIFIIGLSITFAQMVMGGSPIATLKESKKQISNGKDNLTKSIQKLKDSYNQTNNNVIAKLDKAGNDLTPQKNLLGKAYAGSQASRAIMAALTATPLAPITVTALALFGDLPEIIQSLLNTVGSIQNTVFTVENNLKPVNENLNPTTDPKGIYQQGKVAEQKFVEIGNKLDEIIAGFESVLSSI